MSANDIQVGGDHYKTKSIQPWDFIVSNGLGYLEGCVVKYVSRYTLKGGVEDLKKAQHYLSKLIELVDEPIVDQPVTKPAAKAPAMGVRRGRPPGVKNKRRSVK